MLSSFSPDEISSVLLYSGQDGYNAATKLSRGLLIQKEGRAVLLRLPAMPEATSDWLCLSHVPNSVPIIVSRARGLLPWARLRTGTLPVLGR